jgi:hypothetical protein
MSYTPGPWQIAENLVGDGHWTIQGSDGKFVVAPDDGSWIRSFRSSAELEANARLIAAAPDLLEALVIAETCLGDTIEGDKARAAIAKAKGEGEA